MTTTLLIGRREKPCDDRVRKAIDDLRQQFPSFVELLPDAAFITVQNDVEDDIIRTEKAIRKAVCQNAQQRIAQFGTTNEQFELS